MKLILVCILSLFLIACGGGGGGSDEPEIVGPPSPAERADARLRELCGGSAYTKTVIQTHPGKDSVGYYIECANGADGTAFITISGDVDLGVPNREQQCKTQPASYFIREFDKPVEWTPC